MAHKCAHCSARSVGEAMERCFPCPQTRLEEVDPNAEYFILRIDTDPHARVALKAYADSVEQDNPQFAKDIREQLTIVSL